MSCCNKKHHHHHLPNKFNDVSCAKSKPWDEVPALLGLSECGNIVPTEKPEYEMSEEDRDKLDGMVMDGDGSKALFDDGTYKKVYTREQSDEIAGELEERIARNTEAIAGNAEAINDLRGEVADNYLALAGNSEQTSITGDVYTAARIVARQNSPEGTQYRVMVDGTEAGYERFGSSMAQTDIRSSQRPTVNTSNQIAYVSEVEAVKEGLSSSVTDLTGAIDAVQDNLDSAVEELSGSIREVQENVEAVASGLSVLETRVDAAEDAIEANATSIADVQAATEVALDTVNASLDNLDGRVTKNEVDIAINVSEIEALREDLAGRELFRGYYEKTSEITSLDKPVEGNYAWNAETGTVWLYNGATWVDSDIRIPDQTVDAYDVLPRMDGEGDAGSTSRYARGDHQHPSDDSKADLTDLDGYLALTGNSQSSRMSGDIWMATGQMVRLTNSGNSGLRQNADDHVTELVGNSVGGIDLVAPHGTVKYNGSELAVKSDVESAAADISDLQTAVDKNAEDIDILQSDVKGNAGAISEVQEAVDKNAVDIAVLQSDVKENADAIETQASSLSDLQASTESAFDTVNASLETLDGRTTKNEADIVVNASEIEALRDDLAGRELFRGYYETTGEITSLEKPVEGNYAWNAQTGTVWLYNGATWLDSTVKIPDQTVEAYEALPRMDGEGDAGSTNRYARGDHQHPSDDTKADLTELDNYLALVGNSQSSRMKGDIWMATGQMVRLTNSGNSGLRQNADENVTELVGNGVGGIDFIAAHGTVRYNGREVAIKSDVVNAAADIAHLQSAVGKNTEDITALQAGVEDHTKVISGLQTSVGKHTESIASLESDVKDHTDAIAGLQVSVDEHTESITELRSGAEDQSDAISGLQATVGKNTEAIAGLQSDVKIHTEMIEIQAGSLSDLYAATESAFDTVNEFLDSLDGRVTKSEADIALHTSEIEVLREDLASRELFRGYYETTSEITALERPAEGNYAWSAESGTVWLYNGATWLDSSVAIPDQTVEAYDALPRMDGEGDAGSTNRYARGDHQHPSDDSKADLTDLDGYLALAGNTRSSRMTGDIWMTTGQMVRLTNSGNSGLRQNVDEYVTELIGYGVGGIDLVTANGTVKYNGNEVAIKSEVESAAADIADLQTAAGENAENITALQSGMEDTLEAVSDLQSAVDANTGDILELRSDVAGNSAALEELSGMVSKNVTDIQENASGIANQALDIASIRAELASQEHFRGYYATTAEVTAIGDPKTGNYAYNAESGTRWAYNGSTWYDTLDRIPDQTVEAYEGLPLVDGDASEGLVNQYSRGDHRHPTDTSRASAAELAATNLALSGLQSEVSGYHSANDANVSALQKEVAVNEAHIASLTGRFDSNEASINTLTGNVATHTADIAHLTNRVDSGKTSIGTLQTQVKQLGKDLDSLNVDVADIDSRVVTNRNDIVTLQSQYNEQEHFRGFYLSTAEVTSLKAKPGDYAWNSETGTVWVYDPEVPSWKDSTVVIPVQAVFACNALPLQDGTASAGESSDYSRGDHRHPTDESRASATDLTESNNRITLLETSDEDHENRIYALEEVSSGHDTDISGLKVEVSDHEERMFALETVSSDHSGRIVSLEDHVAANASDIESVAGRATELEEVSSGHDADISALQSTVSDQEGRISGLESSSNDHSGRIGSLEDNVAANASDIESVAGRATELEEARSGHDADISALQSTASGQEERIGGLETSNEDHSARISSLENSVAANASDIESVAGRTSTLESQVNGYTLLVVTEEEYQAIAVKDPNTIYYVKED